MALKRFLGSKTTRSLTVLSVLAEVKRAADRGNTLRAIALLGVAVLAWKWTVVGLAAQGVVRLLRGEGGAKGGSA